MFIYFEDQRKITFKLKQYGILKVKKPKVGLQNI